ncbi:hypothetical protein F2Q69_00055631 [Brassica cretica]|uniref:Uncharacterized protein n=1 Tax=Brassica cretica TaxID=69181 RepID=A0A8S9N0U6_BRACR|nr:hypothetical protein F2Q69_00055631 [Brassica cretica]
MSLCAFNSEKGMLIGFYRQAMDAGDRTLNTPMLVLCLEFRRKILRDFRGKKKFRGIISEDLFRRDGSVGCSTLWEIQHTFQTEMLEATNMRLRLPQPRVSHQHAPSSAATSSLRIFRGMHCFCTKPCG